MVDLIRHLSWHLIHIDPKRLNIPPRFRWLFVHMGQNIGHRAWVTCDLICCKTHPLHKLCLHLSIEIASPAGYVSVQMGQSNGWFLVSWSNSLLKASSSILSCSSNRRASWNDASSSSANFAWSRAASSRLKSIASIMSVSTCILGLPEEPIECGLTDRDLDLRPP